MGDVSTCWGVPMAVLIPELPFFCQGPPHRPPQPGIPNRCPCLPFPCSLPRHPSPGLCQQEERVPQIWVVGGERGCTLGPLGGTWSGSFTLHSELQIQVRREGVLTRTSPLKWRTLRYTPSRLLEAGGPQQYFFRLPSPSLHVLTCTHPPAHLTSTPST